MRGSPYRRPPLIAISPPTDRPTGQVEMQRFSPPPGLPPLPPYAVEHKLAFFCIKMYVIARADLNTSIAHTLTAGPVRGGLAATAKGISWCRCRRHTFLVCYSQGRTQHGRGNGTKIHRMILPKKYKHARDRTSHQPQRHGGFK